MTIRIIETGELRSLAYSVDCIDGTVDLIGNSGFWIDNPATYDEDGTLMMAREDYEWWRGYIDNLELNTEELVELCDYLGLDYTEELQALNQGPDYATHNMEFVELINSIKEEYNV